MTPAQARAELQRENDVLRVDLRRARRWRPFAITLLALLAFAVGVIGALYPAATGGAR